MLDGPLVFVDVDTQRDFLEPSGALYVPGSEALAANLARLTGFARAHAIPVLATACSHAFDDEELQHFPPHCLAGTPGQERIEATAWPGGRVLGPEESLDGPPPAHLTVEKRRYDVFSHPAAARIVARYNEAHPTFVVYGVATDYCVRAAAAGLLERGCKVAVVVDAIRAIATENESDVLGALVAAGASLTLTDVVCGD
jgi:nicotinamidase/pyrazinamidase